MWVSPDKLEYKVKITEDSGEDGGVLYGIFYNMPPIKYFHYPFFRFGEDVKTLDLFKNVYITGGEKYNKGIFKELRTTSAASIGGRRRGSTRGRSRYQKATKRVHKTRSKRD